METFPFIKDCLLKFNYPLVDSMNEEEISDIFKSSNRCFLVSWMLKLLDSTYEEVLQNAENNDELLGNLIYELGFCSKKDKLSFIKGELPVTDQVLIIFNIFKFIVDIKKFQGETEVAVTNDELLSLTKVDLNLFPMYGDIKLLKPSERKQKLSELEKEVEAMKANLIENKRESLINVNEDTRECLEEIKHDFLEIESVINNIESHQDIDNQKKIELRPGSVETIKKCCENVKIISQFIKDINTIETFKIQNPDLSKENRNNSTYETVKALYQEVLSVLKYNKCV